MPTVCMRARYRVASAGQVRAETPLARIMPSRRVTPASEASQGNGRAFGDVRPEAYRGCAASTDQLHEKTFPFGLTTRLILCGDNGPLVGCIFGHNDRWPDLHSETGTGRGRRAPASTTRIIRCSRKPTERSQIYGVNWPIPAIRWPTARNCSGSLAIALIPQRGLATAGGLF